MPLSRAMRISWSRVIVRTLEPAVPVGDLRADREPLARRRRSRSRASSRSIAARVGPPQSPRAAAPRGDLRRADGAPHATHGELGRLRHLGEPRAREGQRLALGKAEPEPGRTQGSSPPRRAPALPPALASEASSGSLFRPAASAAASRSLTTALSTNASSTERAFGASSARFVCVCFGFFFTVSDGRASRFSTAARVSASNARRSSCTCARTPPPPPTSPGLAGRSPLAAYATPYRAAHRRYLCALRARASSSGSRLDPATSPPIAGRNHAANPKREQTGHRPRDAPAQARVILVRVRESTGLCAWKSALSAGRARSAAEPRPRSTPEPTSRFSALDAPPASAATARATNLARVARLPRGCATRVPLQGRRRQAAAAARTEALAEGVARIAHAVGAIADPSDDPCAPSRATNDGRVVVCRVRETARARPAFLEGTAARGADLKAD